MATPSTTVRIHLGDKDKLDKLCTLTRRGKSQMLSLLIDDELKRRTAPRKRRRAS